MENRSHVPNHQPVMHIKFSNTITVEKKNLSRQFYRESHDLSIQRAPESAWVPKLAGVRLFVQLQVELLFSTVDDPWIPTKIRVEAQKIQHHTNRNHVIDNKFIPYQPWDVIQMPAFQSFHHHTSNHIHYEP